MQLFASIIIYTLHAPDFLGYAPDASSRVMQADRLGEYEMILDLGPHSIGHVVGSLARRCSGTVRSERSRLSHSTTAPSKSGERRQSSQAQANWYPSPEAAIQWPRSMRRE
jgi:hypothetical protein